MTKEENGNVNEPGPNDFGVVIAKIISIYMQGRMSKEEFLGVWTDTGNALARITEGNRQGSTVLGVDLSKYFEGE